VGIGALVLLVGVTLFFSLLGSFSPPKNLPINKLHRPVFLRANTINNWQAGPFNKFNLLTDNTYEVLINLTAGEHLFKIANRNWAPPTVFGAERPNIVLPVDQKISLSNGGNPHSLSVVVESPGSYLFTLEIKPPVEFFLTFQKLN